MNVKQIRAAMPKKNQGPFEALGFAWFEKHQSKLLWLANTTLVRHWFRWVLRIHKDIKIDDEIISLRPNSYTFITEKGEKKTDFRTHMKFSKRMYYAFKPLWWAMHIADLVLDVYAPQWSFGFATLTAYPDANPETTTVDGRVNNDASGVWATVRGATSGTSINDNETSGDSPSVSWNTGNTNIVRSFLLFDTSSIPDLDTISAATFSQMHAFNSVNNALSTDVVLVSSSPASNTGLVTGDFDQVGTTSFGRVNLSAFGSNGTYVDWALNASGLANISKTGVSKFGLCIGRDFDNSEPNTNSTSSPILMYWADNSGTSNDPKLVVTHGSLTYINMSLLGVG